HFETATVHSSSENDIPSETPDVVQSCAEFKNKCLHVQVQRLVLNIYECLKAERSATSDNDIIKRICVLTKLTHSTVYRVIRAGEVINHSVKRKRNDQSFPKIDDAAKDVICRSVYNIYKENKVPTLEMIRDKLRGYPDYQYKSLETLRNILIHCGFKYKKINNRMVIMESQRIVKLRQEYLRKIKVFREANKNIVYLDETWFDTHDIVKYGWVDKSQNCSLNAPCSRGKRVIILHAGNENGFVPNALLLSAKNIKNSSADYHEDMTANLFEKWFSEQLLPNIPPNSVIVMDNASYHSRILNKIPNQSSKKEDILRFMRKKNMDIPQNIPIKKVLLECIKRQHFKNEYVIDELCKNYDQTVLRLPPYYCIFNPIELVWSSLKNALRKCNQSPTLSAVVLDNIRRVVSNLNDRELWSNCVSHVKQIEDEYYVLPPIDPIVINPDDDSSSEGSEVFDPESLNI
ncbi:MAG: transposase, partial [Candidatus Acidiferrales bacterium]